MKIAFGDATVSERKLNAYITRTASEDDFETAEVNVLKAIASENMSDVDRRFIRHRISDVQHGKKLQKHWY